MAVGLAHLLDFRLPANFRRPYFAVGLGEFWRAGTSRYPNGCATMFTFRWAAAGAAKGRPTEM